LRRGGEGISQTSTTDFAPQKTVHQKGTLVCKRTKIAVEEEKTSLVFYNRKGTGSNRKFEPFNEGPISRKNGFGVPGEMIRN